ncbi:hypothetical protein BSLG_002591 [Batrachochytrium salamandrivorans]|nr:hypothetical protein BSLG_002691 [Batrachochytrium salamandrivorans]KAJ1342934.1 hypothetical protein BSLG_002591 [Batrachochytrium salamandrivorans]
MVSSLYFRADRSGPAGISSYNSIKDAASYILLFISNDPQDQTDPTSLSSKPIERRCRKCEFPKPARAHHCTICKRYFYLFLVYITIGTGYFSIMSAGVAWKVFSGKLEYLFSNHANTAKLDEIFQHGY